MRVLGFDPFVSADQAAKIGCRIDQAGISPTYMAARANLRRHGRDEALRVYEATVGVDHIHRKSCGGETLPTNYPGRTRKRDILLSQLRLNRAPFLKQTLHRWGQEAAPTCPHCQENDKDTEHFLMLCPQGGQR